MRKNRLFLVLLFIFPLHALSAENKTIHLISSSSAYNENSIPNIIKALTKEGYTVDTKYLNQAVSDFGYVNTDRERGKNLIKALSDNEVRYLWFVRGGSGALNLMPALVANLDTIKKSHQKILIGFSDVTAIHYFINKYVNWPSIHGICAGINKDIYNNPESEKLNANNTFSQIFNLMEQGAHYKTLIALNTPAKKGRAGVLRGGNLTLIQSLFSTKYEKNSSDEIIVLEDTGVNYKQLDRTLHQIIYKESFKPKAILFGQFHTLSATDEERLMFKTVLENFAKKVDIPIYYYPYFGHGVTNNPMILNQPATINCKDGEDYCELIQKGIASTSTPSTISLSKQFETSEN